MWNGFARSLGFAAAAALGWWLLQPALAALLGTALAARLYLALAVSLYVLGIGENRSRALRASLALGSAAGFIAWLARPFGVQRQPPSAPLVHPTGEKRLGDCRLEVADQLPLPVDLHPAISWHHKTSACRACHT